MVAPPVPTNEGLKWSKKAEKVVLVYVYGLQPDPVHGFGLMVAAQLMGGCVWIVSMHANPICQLNPIWCLVPRARPKARVEPDYETGYAQVGHITDDMHAFLLDNLMRLIFLADSYL